MQSVGDVLKQMAERWKVTPTAAGEVASVPSEPACPQCGGKGFVRLDVPVAHPQFGEPMPCSCGGPVREVRSAVSCGLGGVLEHMTLDGVQSGRLDPVLWTALQAWAGGLPASLRGSSGWLLMGSVGTGKTGLMAALLHSARQAGLSARFVREVDIVRELQATYHPDVDRDGTETRVMDRYIGTSVLGIDDLGKAYVPGGHQSQQEATGWLSSRLYAILDERQTRGRPTLLTTNLGDEALQRRLGDALADRLSTLTMVRFSGESRR